MLNEKKPPECCLRGGCIDQRWCERCGFNREEDKRRKDIPLTLGKDGLLRKLIPAKPQMETNNEKQDK